MGNWKEIVVGKEAEILPGYAFDAKYFSEKSKGIPLIRIRDLKTYNTEVNYTGNYTEKYLVENGNVLVGMDGDFHVVRWKGGKALLNQRVCKISSNRSIDNTLLFYLLIDEIQKIQDQTTGTTVKHLSHLEVSKIRILVPEEEKEQSTIATILATIDQAIEKIEQLIAKYELIKIGLMQDLLTGGIDEEGNIRSEGTHEFKDSALGKVPNEWNVITLQECCDSIITYGIVQAGEHLEAGIPYIRTGDMSGEYLDKKGMLLTSEKVAKKFERSKVEVGDIVFALRATVGKVLPVPDELHGANLTQGTAKISPKAEIDEKFVLWMLKSENVQDQIRLNVKGTTFPEITLENLRKIKIGIPHTRKEQEKISETLEKINTLVVEQKKYFEKLNCQKRGLMKDLLTGNVCVTGLTI